MNLNSKEKKLIEKHKAFYESLDTGKRKPDTPEQKRFIRVCHGLEKPSTSHEFAYLKYKHFEGWYATSQVIDLYQDGDHLKKYGNKCDLCTRSNLRWHCELIHITSKKNMYVGSECIKKFEIPGMDNLGKTLNNADTLKNINHTINEMKKQTDMNKVTGWLTQLKEKESAAGLKIDEAKAYYYEKRRFTPKALCMIIKGCQKHNIPFDPKLLKTGLQMKDKEEMVKMNEPDFQIITPYIKKTHLDKIKGYRRLGVAF